MINFFKGNKTISLLCMIAIAFLSLIPQEKLPPPHFSYEDLLVHLAMYSGLALCITFTMSNTTKTNKNNTFKAFLFIVMYGITMEVLQKYLPINRFFSLSDILANSLGASFIFIFRKYI